MKTNHTLTGKEAEWLTSKNEFSDSECSYLKHGKRVGSLAGCKVLCHETPSCTAFNYKRSSHGCVLRSCKLPVVPPAKDAWPTYDGYWLSGRDKLAPVTALMSSTKLKLGAEKCINGKEDGPDIHVQHKSDMCHTKAEPAPWFAIDYGEEVRVSVGKTVIVNRKHCCGERAKNIEVRLSNELPTDGESMYTGGILLGKFEGPGTSGGTIEIESEERWEQLVGRYLIVQMDNGKHPLHFKEVTAFGKALSLA